MKRVFFLIGLGLVALVGCDQLGSAKKAEQAPAAPVAPLPPPPPGTVLPADATAELGPVKSFETVILTPQKLTAAEPFAAYAVYENVRSLNGNPTEKFPAGFIVLNPGGKIGAMIGDKPKARGYVSCGGVDLANAVAEVEIGYKGLQPDSRPDLALIPAKFDPVEGRIYAVGPQSFGDLRGATGRITISLDPRSPPATLTDCVFGWVQIDKKKD